MGYQNPRHLIQHMKYFPSALLVVFFATITFRVEAQSLTKTTKVGSCEDLNYKHKTLSELVTMSPAQLIEERVKERIYHVLSSYDRYSTELVFPNVRAAGVKMLPSIADNINNYYPMEADLCG